VIHRIVFKSQEAIVLAGGGLPPNSGPRLKHPNIPLPWNGGGPSSSPTEVVVRVPGSAKPEKGFTVLGALRNEIDCQEPAAGLLGQYVALLAMKDGRAPLPVSPTRWRALLRRGLTDDAAGLGHVARRYLFLGDASMLLTESRNLPAPVAESVAAVKQLNEERLRH
jgi:hypothetical protein